MVKKRNILEIYNLNLLFWCIHFDLLTFIWKINVWNNSLLIYRRKDKLLFPCLYSDQPSLCNVSVRLEKTKCITCKRQKRIFYSQFNCALLASWCFNIIFFILNWKWELDLMVLYSLRATPKAEILIQLLLNMTKNSHNSRLCL